MQKQANRLWKALDLLRSGRMIKHFRNDGNGGYCALGLLDAVHTGDYENYDDDVTALNKVADELFEPRPPHAYAGLYLGGSAGAHSKLADFNNHPATTQADLELVFEKAAIRADEVLS